MGIASAPQPTFTQDDILEILSMFNPIILEALTISCAVAECTARDEFHKGVSDGGREILERQIKLSTKMQELIKESGKERRALNDRISVVRSN